MRNNIIKILLWITISSILIFSGLSYSGRMSESPTPPPTSIKFQNQIIIPEYVTGFTIQKYAVASMDEDVWEYVILIHGINDYNPPGIVFDTREKAERVMIWLAKECGI